MTSLRGVAHPESDPALSARDGTLPTRANGSNGNGHANRLGNHAGRAPQGAGADTEVIRGGKREPRTEVINPAIARTEVISLRRSNTEVFAPLIGEQESPSTWLAKNIATVLFVLAFLAVFVIWFRPTVLGGPAGYIIVSGTSMEPTYHDLDMVVTQKLAGYEVGDIIAYRIPEGQPGAGAQIIHRVVGGNGEDGYVTKGDNRRVEDPWKPTNDDVIGTPWFVIPQAGKAFNWLRTRYAIAGLVALLAGVVTLDYLYTRNKKDEELAVSEAHWKGEQYSAPSHDALSEAAASEELLTPGDGIQAAYEGLTSAHALLTQLAARSANSEAARVNLEQAYRALLDAYDELSEELADEI